MLKSLIAAVLAIVIAIITPTFPAYAKHHHKHHHKHLVAHYVKEPDQLGFNWGASLFKMPVKAIGAVTGALKTVQATLLPHPANCPHTAFCGCGAADEVGRGNDRSLWLAANWFKFPRTVPDPGMAAVKTHHVFVLKEHIEGDVWLVVDHNSGQHLSRLHPRSISGWTIVNPS